MSELFLESPTECAKYRARISGWLERFMSRKERIRAVTPGWANLRAVGKIYGRMRRLNRQAGYIKYVVDHIVPLHSDLVCGLHCEDNLQVITKVENDSKQNTFWPGHPHEAADMFGDDHEPHQMKLL